MTYSNKLKILLISPGEVSGVRPALMAAFERAGCEVIFERQGLRVLGALRYWHALRMIASALCVYRRDARAMIERTRAAFVARSRACKAMVDQKQGVDVVLLIGANCSNYWGKRPEGVQFAIYTDYMNLLSKALPNRGFAIPEKKTYPLWNELERQAVLSQDHFFVMGSLMKPAIEAAYAIEPGKITAVGAGPGHDLDIVRDGGSKHPSNKRILFVGRQAERKGLYVLLRAFALVRRDFPDALLDVVAGASVSAPGVTSHGDLNRAALKHLFYTANIFAMPSFREPLGLVFLEAMLSKAACLGTTTGSIPDVIRHGETGYLVESGDEVTLADRLACLLGDPVRTKDMGERGYDAAKEYWQWDLVVERMSRVLRERREAPAAVTETRAFG